MHIDPAIAEVAIAPDVVEVPLRVDHSEVVAGADG
jgi:hypothetical protein